MVKIFFTVLDMKNMIYFIYYYQYLTYPKILYFFNTYLDRKTWSELENH